MRLKIFHHQSHLQPFWQLEGEVPVVDGREVERVLLGGELADGLDREGLVGATIRKKRDFFKKIANVKQQH